MLSPSVRLPQLACSWLPNSSRRMSSTVQPLLMGAKLLHPVVRWSNCTLLNAVLSNLTHKSLSMQISLRCWRVRSQQSA